MARSPTGQPSKDDLHQKEYPTHINELYEKCMKENTKHMITASDVSRFITSPFSIYCDHFVDPSEKVWVADPYLEQLAKVGVEHERQFIEKEYPGTVKLRLDTPEDEFKYALNSMANGAESICGFSLFYLPHGVHGKPDILERRDGASDFGAHHYIVKEVKLATNIEPAHILQAAFYNSMIGKIQGHTPDTFYLIDGEQRQIPYKFSDHEDRLYEVIGGINDLYNGAMPPPTYGSCRSPWGIYCDNKAVEARDIHVIPRRH